MEGEPQAFEWIFLLVPLVFIVLGIVIGGFNAREHLKSLDRRERALSSITVNNLKRIHDPDSAIRGKMVMGQVVIATDYFKSFATAMRNLVGGEMRSAQGLMNRGRREALVRMLEQAKHLDADEVWNVRFGFSNISQMRGKSGAMQVEVVAWGTAVQRARASSPSDA